jgi:hypothetical protein
MGRIRVRDPILSREITTIQGERIASPEPEFRIHLQFRRFAGRAGCNSVGLGRQEEWKSQGDLNNA